MTSIYLPFPELIGCISIYISALTYGFYQAYLIGNELTTKPYFYFTDGWIILGRKRDDIDTEWEAFKLLTIKYIFWIICHILLTEIVRFIDPRRVVHTHAFTGVAFVVLNYDCFIILTTATLILTYYLLRRTRPFYVWTLTISWLIVMNLLKLDSIQQWLKIDMPDSLMYEVFVYFLWMVLRLVSFSLDFCRANESTRHLHSFVIYLGYVFYLPTMLHGPPMIFQRYAHMLPLNQFQRIEDFLERLKNLIVVFLKLTIWCFVYEFAMHFIYANVVAFNPQVARSINRWALYGFGIAIGQFFCIKYIIMYGFGSAIARYERIDAPSPPKCVARIQVYSNMWRYFDQGLHEFLFIYIYKGICDRTASTPRKLLASIAAFTFIYLWHGYYRYILIWAVLNFLCLQAENVGKKCTELRAYEHLMTTIGRNNRFRLKAIIGSQLLIMSVLSNMMFVGGEDIGIELARQTYLKNGISNYLVLSVCTYCFYQTGEFCFRWEAHKASR